MKIVIYQTSDLHGYVYPTNYVSEIPAGILKIGSYIKKDEINYDRSIKIDCGDLIQGSPLTHYLYKTNIHKNPIIEGLKNINYDAYVFGNHEFNYGLDYLYKSYSSVADKIINSNIVGLKLNTKPYEIFEFDGFKIGVIGLTTSFIPNWEREINIEGLTFKDPVEMYGKYEKQLKEKCDLIVVCYHGGFERSIEDNKTPTEVLTKENQGSELLEKFSSIDIILSGHQHRSFIKKIDNRICSQPLNNGYNFTKIVIDTETKDINYELVNVKDINVQIDEELESIFKNTENDLQIYLDKQIGTFDKEIRIDDIFVARLNGHPFINFLHQVQLEVGEADISVCSLFDSAIGFKENVSIRDVLINYPYPNTLKVLKVTGENIRKAIEKACSYFILEEGKVKINPEFLVPKLQNYNYDTFGGITYEVDLNREIGNRVLSIKINGKELDLNKYYSVIMNNYRATNTSIYPSYENAEVLKEINIDMSEIIIDYIQNKKTIKSTDEKNYRFIY